MKKEQSFLKSFIDGWSEFVVEKRVMILVVSLLAAIAMGTGVIHLSLKNNYRMFFSPENPELITYDDFQQTYSKSDNILFVVKPRSGKDIYTPDTINAIQELTEKSWNIPYSTRVDSITNFQHTWSEHDDLYVKDLYSYSQPLDAQSLERMAQIAESEPLLKGALVSSDGTAAGVNITLNFPQKSLTELPEALSMAYGLEKEIETKYENLEVAVTGISALNNAFSSSGQIDAMTLMPMMFGFIVLAMLITLRSLSSTIATVLVIMISSASAMGLAGHFGLALDPISITAGIVILTLAVADSVHIVVTALGLMSHGKSKHESIKESIRINIAAVTVTSITTLVGFLTLNYSDSPPFWYLGNITSIGIICAWAFALSFLPALLAVLPLKPKKTAADGSRFSERVMKSLSYLVTSRYKMVLLLVTAISVLFISFVPRIELDDQWVKYFDYRVQFRGDAEFAMDNLTGLYVLEYPMKSHGEGGIHEHEYLENLEKFADWLKTQPEVMHVFSYTDIIKRLNKNIHGDNPDFYGLPEKPDEAAQYLLLYELSLPYGLDLNNRISIDKSQTRLSVIVKELSTSQVRDFIDKSETWLTHNTPEYMWTKPTGPTVMFSYISKRNIEGMLGGNVIAVVCIALLLIVTLRNFGLGMLSLIPNLLPILVTFGVWALLVGQISMGAATVSATSLGIVVDNTVHFLIKYLRARNILGHNRPMAIEYAFKTVGMAIFINAVILAVGFSVLATSSFSVNMEMGQLTAMTIMIALIIDFLMLPALLMLGYQKQEEEVDGDVVYQNG